MKKPTTHQITLILFLGASFSALITGVTVWIIMGIRGGMLEETIDNRLLANTTRVAAAVTAKELAAITRPEDADTFLYATLKERLHLLVKNNRITRAYFARETADGRLQYIVDSVYGEGSEGIATPAVDERDSRDVLKQAFGGKSVVQELGMYVENAEGMISAFCPIFDADANVVAVAGVDLPDAAVVRINFQARVVGSMVFLTVILTIVSGIMTFVSYHRAAGRATAALADLQNATEQIIENEKFTALGSLVAGIAHEVNTPLGIGVTAASYLGEITTTLTKSFEAETLTRSDFVAFTTTCTETVEILLNNMKRAAELIQSFKRIAVDQSDENRHTIALREYLKDIIVSMTPSLKKTRIRVVMDCPEYLRVNTMPGALGQIFTNLITNTITHAFDPGEEGEITITAQMARDTLVLGYADNGRGIPPDHLRRVFDPFFTTSRGQGGSGLGLSLVQNIVTHKLKGRIELDSAMGRGTRFSITLPDSAPRDE